MSGSRPLRGPCGHIVDRTRRDGKRRPGSYCNSCRQRERRAGAPVVEVDIGPRPEFPVRIMLRPAALPVFDPNWSAPCLSCANVDVTIGHRSERRLSCQLLRGRGHQNLGPCLDARAEGGPCGPDAKLRREA